jgi:UDP-N-acetylglucosamine 4,6-dehydratase
MGADFTDKVILVTGGTGSFGRQFVKTVLDRYRVRKVIVFSRDESKQHDMAQDPALAPHLHRLRFFIGDVRELSRLEMAFREVDYVVHAAALKHIGAAEYNPFECIQTNVHGAENVVRAAIRLGVRKVVALSTDKAASPINLYGASKLAADKIFIAAKSLVGAAGRPEFAVVRYGNVFGSRGSVVPLFRQMIARGATSLPITDPRMTRFWITLPQGVDFVLSCFGMMQGGEIFVPKIPSMKVIDLAKAMAPDLPTHVVGIRAGEKLHELMITEGDARSTLELPDRFVIRSQLYGEQRGYDPAEQLLGEGFHYASDSNTQWLDAESLRTMLSDSSIAALAAHGQRGD